MKLGTFEQASQALICVMVEKSLILFSFVEYHVSAFLLLIMACVSYR